MQALATEAEAEAELTVPPDAKDVRVVSVPAGPPPEPRNSFEAHVLRGLADISRDIRAVREEAQLDRSDIGHLKQAVFGSKPPPGTVPQGKPLLMRQSQHEAQADESRGMILAVDAKVEKLLRLKGITPETPPDEPDPSGWQKFKTFVGSREAAKMVVALATLAGMGWTTFQLAVRPPTTPTMIVAPPHGTVQP